MITPYVEKHIEAFGEEPDLLIRVPGRVNLIGEHTDYNEGWVLPAALPMATVITARRQVSGNLRTVAPRVEGVDCASLDNLGAGNPPEWTRYIRGVAQMLQAAGCPLTGADLRIDGDLPLNSGLSSSASLEVAVALALTKLGNYEMDGKSVALLCQRTENEVLGVQSGIMDQLTALFGVASNVLLIDCRTLQINPVSFPSDAAILILDSGTRRKLVSSSINQRRAECGSALRKLQLAAPGISALRDVTLDLLAVEGWRLNDTERRRTQHVVTENERVGLFVKALVEGNLFEAGRLMVESHQSLHRDYEVSTVELDILVTLAVDIPGVFGARLTGAGFGGCAVALAEAGRAQIAGESIVKNYKKATSIEGNFYACMPVDGAQVIDLQ